MIRTTKCGALRSGLDAETARAQAARMRIRLVVIAIVAVVIGLAGGWFGRGAWASDRCLDAGGSWITVVDGCDLPDPAMRSARARLPIVRDAMRRWAAKDALSVDKAMQGRTIEMVSLKDRECVSFGLGDFDVGGVPTYCYRPNSTHLVSEDSDVE